MTTSAEDDEKLRAARHAVFAALIWRMRFLHASKEPPSAYYAGQEYVEDSAKLKCEIQVKFIFPTLVERTEFWLRKSRIVIESNPPVLDIHIYRDIPGRLWDDIKFLRRGDQFIAGYVNALMPAINRVLLDNRYFNAQPLSRTFFLQEALGIVLVHGNQQIRMHWPKSVLPFPPSAQLAPGRNEVYLRDFIDAVHCYFKNDFDDCIRRIITSAENFFDSLRWRAKFGKNSFRNILFDNVDTTSFDNQVITENLMFVYGIRNRIVHRGFRMNVSSALFCDKAVSTLRYLIYRHAGDGLISRYVHTLGMQFLMLQQIAGSALNLDDIEKANLSSSGGGAAIDSMEEFNRMMFTSLRFTPRDKSSIRH